MTSMKRIALAVVASLVLFGGIARSAKADLQCYPGIKVSTPGAPDNFMCWAEIVDNCEFCTEEIVVKG